MFSSKSWAGMSRFDSPLAYSTSKSFLMNLLAARAVVADARRKSDFMLCKPVSRVKSRNKLEQRVETVDHFNHGLDSQLKSSSNPSAAPDVDEE